MLNGAILILRVVYVQENKRQSMSLQSLSSRDQITLVSFCSPLVQLNYSTFVELKTQN